MGLPKVQRVFVGKNGPKSSYHQVKKLKLPYLDIKFQQVAAL